MEHVINSQIKTSRKLFLLGIAGSILWLLADIVLGYLPGGIAKAGFMSDPNILGQVLHGAPLWRFPVSAVICTLGMTLSIFGYIGIYSSYKYKGLLSKIVLLCAMAASVGGAVYHTICTSSEWIYVKLGGGEKSFALLTDFMAGQTLPMKVCGLCWCLFGILFLISVIAKRTVFPRWCVIFNIMIFYPLLMMAGYPGYMSGGALIMFLGLFLFLKEE